MNKSIIYYSDTTKKEWEILRTLCPMTIFQYEKWDKILGRHQIFKD